MKIYTEQSVKNFQFWGGAKDVWNEVEKSDRYDEICEYVESSFSEDIYPEGVEDTCLNDYVWFELSDRLWEDLQIDLYGDHESDEDDECFDVDVDEDKEFEVKDVVLPSGVQATISRGDLESFSQPFDTSEVSDETMQELADLVSQDIKNRNFDESAPDYKDRFLDAFDEIIEKEAVYLGIPYEE